VGCSAPWLAHATIRIAASVCGSAVSPTACIAVSSACRLSLTASSRSRQNFPTPPLHSRSRAAIASVNAAWALVTAGVTRDARTSVTSLMLVDANRCSPSRQRRTSIARRRPRPALSPVFGTATAQRRRRAEQGQPDRRPNPVAMRHGKAAEFEIEREARINRLLKQPPPISPEFELEFADPLDHSCRPYRISSLTLNGQPLFGIPDIVYRHKASGDITVFERKVTSARPDEWPNLKVQLWCYGRIDKWKNAKRTRLRGSIYSPKYDLKHAKPVGSWERDDEVFDSECRQLFELFGGRVIG
jgi:hypothetical protein